MSVTWHHEFCKCYDHPCLCLVIGAFSWTGLSAVQYYGLRRIHSTNPSPIIGSVATHFCTAFGAAWCRQAIRRAAGLEEDYWTDCAAYAGGCICCMGVQEWVEVKRITAATKT